MKLFKVKLFHGHCIRRPLFLLLVCSSSNNIFAVANGVITSVFSHPCDSGVLTPPDADEIDAIEDSQFVALCNGEYTFGECGDDCCVSNGNPACTGATLWLKKDNSCFGVSSCENTSVDVVVNGCITTEEDIGSVCQNMEASGSQVINSCLGPQACYDIASDGGSVGDIVSSCIESTSCHRLGRGGKVGMVENSCQGSGTCMSVGVNTQFGVGDIFNSCFGIQACNVLGGSDGSVGDIISSCTGNLSCFLLGYSGGRTGNIVDSCGGYNACRSLGQNGIVGNLSRSCASQNACQNLGKNGVVGNVESSCCTLISGGTGSCESYCEDNNGGSVPGGCGNDFIFLNDDGLCPSDAPSSMPSSSPVPTMFPTMLDRQIHALISDLVVDLEDLPTKITTIENNTDTLLKKVESITCEPNELVQTIENNTDILLKKVESVVRIDVSVQSQSRGLQSTRTVVVLVTVGGVKTDADSDPVLSAMATSVGSGSSLEVVTDAIVEKVAEGFYKIDFQGSNNFYLLGVTVGGNEQTVLVDFASQC